MITIIIFVFNPFQVNTYLLYDSTKECIIIDPGCYNAQEFDVLKKYISDNALKPVAFYNTHCHIDHIAGNHFVSNHYKIPMGAHKDGKYFLDKAKLHALGYGFVIEEVVYPEIFPEEGTDIKFGASSLKVIHVPGHADGSICFYSEENKFLIAGDVLFNGSIGRTDLPTGDYDMLITNIQNKLMTLPDEVVVYSGHGDTTSIGNEKKFNPFLND